MEREDDEIKQLIQDGADQADEKLNRIIAELKCIRATLDRMIAEIDRVNS